MIWRRSGGDDRENGIPELSSVPEVRGPAQVELGFRGALERTDGVPDARERARALLATIREFLGKIEDFELSRNSSALQARLAAAAAEFPDEALRVLADVSWRCDIDETVSRGVFGRWMRTPDAESFAATWGPAVGLLTQSSELAAWMSSAVRAADAEVSAEFHTLLRAHLTRVVDEQFEKYEFGGANSPVWQLLYALGPANRADWFCVLGDLAAERGDETVAAHRYEVADRFGGTGIKERLARLHDIGSYHRLLGGATTEDKLKGPGSPSGYRHLVLAAGAVIRGASVGNHLRDTDRGADGHFGSTVILLSALDLLRQGDQKAARRKLEEAAPGGDDSAINAKLVLGALDSDDRMIADAARDLLARHGRDWPTRSLVAPATVLTAVSRSDPALLPGLIAAAPGESGGELDALRDAAASLVLAKATRAALFSRPGDTRTLLDEARNLLNSAADDEARRLLDTAARISELTDAVGGELHQISTATTELGRPFDRLAFTALRGEGQTLPTTPEALRLWRELDAEPGGTDRSLHHLAIAEHAAAYRLEIAGDDAAFDHWRAALGYWARLHGEPTFWEHLRAHLTAVMPDATADDITRAVDETRTELPTRLLEPHISRVIELHKDQSARARAHLELIRTAPFATADVDSARTRVSREAGAQIRRLIRESELDRAMDEARAWTAIDDDNIPLAELMLDVGIEHVESSRQRGDDWDVARPVMERIAEVVEPIRVTLHVTNRLLAARGRPTYDHTDHAAFAAKLARFEFWLGACQLMSTYEAYRQNPFADRTGFRTAATHFHSAMTLGLPQRKPYDQARQLLVDAGRLQRAASGEFVGFL